MRALFFGTGLAALVAGGQAQGTGTGVECLPPRQMHEALAEHGLVAPEAAVIVARRATPGSDVLRASLCRDRDALVYVIVTLRRDGRIVQVIVDASSGKVKSVR